MKYYAIQDRKTGRYISGTNFRGVKPRQMLSTAYRPPRLFHGEELASEIRRRHINTKHYKVVVVEVRRAEL